MAIDKTALRRYVERKISNINTMFVGIIEKVDVANMKYNVKPIINAYDEVEDKSIESATLFECPIMAQKSGSFYIRVPYAIGDVVYVGVCKDALDESLASNVPRDNKMIGISNFRAIDGVVLGGLMCETEEKLSGENIDDLIIQNRANKDKIVLKKNGGAEIKVGSLVKIDAPTTHITGVLNVDGVVNAKSDANITGNTTISQNLNVSGAGTIGSVTTADGTSLDSHTHTYYKGGGALTNTGSAKG